MGVPLELLREELARTRADDGDGIVWSPAAWERVWSRLTSRQQAVVFLHAVQGRTHSEVAEMLGIGRGAVDGAWRRALDRIRAALPRP